MIKGNESHVGYSQIWGYDIIDMSNLDANISRQKLWSHDRDMNSSLNL